MSRNICEETRLMTKILVIAHSEHQALDEALQRRSLRLLYEEIDPKEVAKNITDSKEALAKFLGLFPSDKSDEIKNAFNEILKKVPDASEISASTFSGDAKSIAIASKAIALGSSNLSKAISTFSNAFEKVNNALQPYSGKLSDEEKKLTINTLLQNVKNSPEEWKNKFITSDKFDNGLKAAFSPADEWKTNFSKGMAKAEKAASGGVKGLFNKVKNFFSSAMSGSSVKAFPKLFDAFKKFVMNASIGEIAEISKKISENNQLIANAEISSSAAAAQAGEKGGEAAGGKEAATKPTSAENAANVPEETSEKEKLSVDATAKKEFNIAGGKGEVSKLELAKILKSSPDIVGTGPKANKARAAFRKAINAAAGKKVFEEALLIGNQQEKTDNVTIERWCQLAGIK